MRRDASLGTQSNAVRVALSADMMCAMKLRVFSAVLISMLSWTGLGCTTRNQDARPSPDAASPEADSGLLTEDAGIPRADGGQRPPSSDCTERARWIYLVDSNNAFLRFEPDSGSITPIGSLSCTRDGRPFSMAVNRHADAFVLHSDHRIYRVSTADASCSPTDFAPDQMGFELFGMGFVSQSEGSNIEHLFVAGGPAANVGRGSSTLGQIDPSAWALTSIAPVSGFPELSGTGTGELWGFFPDGSRMTVRQLDKSSGGTLREIDVSSIDPYRFGPPEAWAFAAWGGRFYLFYQGSFDLSTCIYRVTPDTGAIETIEQDIGYRIVGAGVSTCAPTILF